VRTFIGESRLRRRRGHVRVASFAVGAALLIAGCSSTTTSSTSTASRGARAIAPPASTPGSSALKPIDQAALHATVDRTAQELLVPGAVVILRTPQGEFTLHRE